jgi:hypothetical protein
VKAALLCRRCHLHPKRKGFYGFCSQKCRESKKSTKRKRQEAEEEQEEEEQEEKEEEQEEEVVEEEEQEEEEEEQQQQEQVQEQQDEQQQQQRRRRRQLQEAQAEQEEPEDGVKAALLCRRCHLHPKRKGFYGFCSQKCRENGKKSSSAGNSRLVGTKRKSPQSTRPMKAEDAHNSQCQACGKGGKLICCDGCTLVYHLKCLSWTARPLADAYLDVWHCPVCEGDHA